MGYRVEYGPVKKVRRLEERVSRRSALTGLFLLLFLFSVCAFWPEGRDTLRRLVFPGDPAVTAAAFEEMTEELRSGSGVMDSLRIFCLRILEGAGLDPY